MLQRRWQWQCFGLESHPSVFTGRKTPCLRSVTSCRECFVIWPKFLLSDERKKCPLSMLDYKIFFSSVKYCPTTKSLLILNFMSRLAHCLAIFGPPLDNFHQTLITWVQRAAVESVVEMNLNSVLSSPWQMPICRGMLRSPCSVLQAWVGWGILLIIKPYEPALTGHYSHLLCCVVDQVLLD